jgi:cell filamentation protein
VSERPRRYGWEDYLYPPNEAGIQVLRNKLGLTNYVAAFNAERQLTAGRQIELTARPDLVARTFDSAHWKAIHRQIFQDVYEWAGEFRTVDIDKGGHGFAAQTSSRSTRAGSSARSAGRTCSLAGTVAAWWRG